MKILISILVAFLNFSNHSIHDSIIANFNVIETGDVLMLEIDFNSHDFLKLNKSKEHKITKDAFICYLNKTSSWIIDGEKLLPQVLSIKSNNHHTKAICLLNKLVKKLKIIKIRNEFLLDIKNHSNIVKLDLNGTSKDYRLHKERREIIVDYNKYF